MIRNTSNNRATHPVYLLWTVVVLFFIALVGCGSTVKQNVSGQSFKTSQGGGYYLDDGPENNPPINLDAIPDAIPKTEVLRKANMRPYTALGKLFQPMTALTEYKAQGIASWYGRRYHGNQTASGEVYDMYAMTAAHPTLPLPSYARITNINNGKTIVVKINDRGPFLANRIIDLSYTAAYKMDILEGGSGMVEVESIIPGKTLNTQVQSHEEPTPSAQISVATEAIDTIYLQLGAFATANNANNFLLKMQSKLPWLGDDLNIAQKDGLFKIHAGPFSDLILAWQTAEEITQHLEIYPLIVID